MNLKYLLAGSSLIVLLLMMANSSNVSADVLTVNGDTQVVGRQDYSDNIATSEDGIKYISGNIVLNGALIANNNINGMNVEAGGRGRVTTTDINFVSVIENQ